LKKRYATIAIIAIVVSLFFIAANTMLTVSSDNFSVLIVFNPENLGKYSYVLDAYESVLQEEGVPVTRMSAVTLLSLSEKNFEKLHPAVIFADGVNQSLPMDIREWAKSYLEKGGNVAVISDAGTKDHKGSFLEEGVFREILSLNNITYKENKKSFTYGYLQIEKNSMDFLDIPPGKTLGRNLLGAYSYGKLKYPIARVKNEGVRKSDVCAWAVTKSGFKSPGIVFKNYGKGKVMYTCLPLGYLKANADDFPLRKLLRAFLFKAVKIPHLLNTPEGKGGLVVNWHIDSSIDWKSIPYLIQNGDIRKDVKCSFHITAGDFRDAPGDRLGFDAHGKGREFVLNLLEYGVVGSHGGWGHNWFAENVQKKVFSEKDIYKYIRKNNDCLELVTGYRPREYSAPNGVHPQPVTTRVLEKLGFTCYYYTGDNGSSPNRTFIDERVISKSIIAFPISSLGKYASLGDMHKMNVSEQKVSSWLKSIIDYAVKTRSVKLVYSHPYDIGNYPNAFKEFMDYAESAQQNGLLKIQPMSYFADFTRRFLKTKFTCDTSKRKITLTNPQGLSDTILALPGNMTTGHLQEGISASSDGNYNYVIFSGDFKKTKASIPFSNKRQKVTGH